MKTEPKLFAQVILKARPELGPWQVTQIKSGKKGILSPKLFTIEQEHEILPGLKVVTKHEIEEYRP